jgi:hypothetical protein
VAEGKAMAVAAGGAQARRCKGSGLVVAGFLRKTWAFIVRDYQIETSYKLDFFLKSFNSILHFAHV